jgi:hypothetical protein
MVAGRTLRARKEARKSLEAIVFNLITKETGLSFCLFFRSQVKKKTEY